MLCGDWLMDPNNNGLVDGYAYYCAQEMIDGHRKGRYTPGNGANRTLVSGSVSLAIIMAFLNV